jgi:hypothetical protein
MSNFKFPKIEFKHLFGIGLMAMAGLVFYGAMFRIIPEKNDKYVATILQAFIGMIIMLAGYFWGSSDGSKKKDAAMIDMAQPTTPSTTTTTVPGKTTTITAPSILPEGAPTKSMAPLTKSQYEIVKNAIISQQLGDEYLSVLSDYMTGKPIDLPSDLQAIIDQVKATS